MLNALICLLAVMSLSVFFTQYVGKNSAFAPLLSLSAAMLYFMLAGVLGVLAAAAWLFYAACFGLGAFAFFRGRLRLLKSLVSPGFLLFALLSLFLLFYLAAKQPTFTEWDEFSLWGTAPKLMLSSGELYTTADIGWPVTQTQSPALMLLSYMCQFFGAQFAPWQVFWILDVLMIACVAALISPFGFRRWRTALPLAIAGLLAPFFFGVINGTVTLSTVWMSAYADIPAGMLMAGTMAVYFAGRHTKNGRAILAVLPLAALSLTKDNVMPVALVCAAVMAIDCLFFSQYSVPYQKMGARIERFATKHRRITGLFVGLCRGGVWFLAVGAPYLFWRGYSAAVLAQSTTAAGALTQTSADITTSGASVTSSVLSAFTQLFGITPQTPQAQAALQEMSNYFFGWVGSGTPEAYQLNSSMAGSGIQTLLLIGIIFGAAVLFSSGMAKKMQSFFTMIIMFCGYMGYHFMLFVFYGFVYNLREVSAIVDYPRYMATYYTGWLLTGLLLLALCTLKKRECAQNAAEDAPPCTPEDAPVSFAQALGDALPIFAKTGVLAVSVFMLLHFSIMVYPGHSVLDYPDVYMQEDRHREELAQGVSQHLPQDARVFFVSQSGSGESWFRYSQYLLPAVLEYSMSGGSALSPEVLAEQKAEQGGPQQATLSDEESLAFVQDYLSENGCEYILVESTDEWFTQVFGGMFTDGLQSAPSPDAPILYRLNESGLYEQVTA